MNTFTTNFAEVKIGLLTLDVAVADGRLVFHVGHLRKQLKLEQEVLDRNYDQFVVIDGAGHAHTVLSEDDLYAIVLTSKAKVARQFQNWVLHCVLPAVLVDRFYFVGEERGGTPSDLVLDPKDAFYGLPDAHLDWIARRVLPAIREEGGFYTDHETQNPSAVAPKRLKAECMMGATGLAKSARFQQQASRKRFVRIARQFQQMRETTALPEVTFQWDAETEMAS